MSLPQKPGSGFNMKRTAIWGKLKNLSEKHGLSILPQITGIGESATILSAK
jgi:hypothetical protein